MAEPPKPPKSSKSPPQQAPFPFTPQDAMSFMQRMWNPFGVAIPGFGAPGVPPPQSGAAPAAAPMMPFANPAMMFAALDPAEVERKIGELRIIEGWLKMSLDMMQMSIKTMELQKASLEAMRGTPGGSAPPQGK
ncbi:MAG TPA: PhaM family polyhydroxyalkanoate granule multifunctional regulatory protein [Steroidobacteraceae bacterium]|jgi:hypothetical protein